MKKLIFVLLCPVMAFLASCSETVESFGKIGELQSAVSKKYKTNSVHVNLHNEKYLTVSLINTPYNDSLPSAQRRVACEIGEIVLKIYKPEDKIEGGRVNIVTNSNYVIINMSSSASFNMKLDSLKTAGKDTVISK